MVKPKYVQTNFFAKLVKPKKPLKIRVDIVKQRLQEKINMLKIESKAINEQLRLNERYMGSYESAEYKQDLAKNQRRLEQLEKRLEKVKKM
jgi:transcription elongation GreA/GreB family factor